MITLGSIAKDTITEYEGVVVSISKWRNGTTSATLQAKGLKDGQPHKRYDAEIGALEVVQEKPDGARDWSEPSLGSRVRHRITGFTGIVTGQTQWLNGCDRVFVESEELREGKPVGGVWLDTDSAETIEPSAMAVQENKGGPTPAPEIR